MLPHPRLRVGLPYVFWPRIVLVLRRQPILLLERNDDGGTDCRIGWTFTASRSVAIDYVASSFRVAKDLNGLHRHVRDQWLRAAQSIPLNIAEGNGKRVLKRIVSMLTRLIARGDVVREDSVE